MKKLSVIVVAFLALTSFCSLSAHAQGLRLGVKAGANLSNLSGNLTNEDRFQNKIGFHGGLLLNAGLVGDGFLSIQPELLYSQKGFKNKDKEYSLLGNTLKFTGKTNYNYLDLPILLKINAGGLFFEAGPQFSYLLNVKDDSKRYVNGQQTSYTSSERDLNNVNRFEVGYAAGLGFQADSGPMIGIRYNGAFTDFSKDGYQNNDLRNARNQVFQAYVGFLIPSK
ncbi:porin family protein [Hymenobacter jejuensis]|uniref:PorT family protein n=1 Tax=Hymenobacter jejuensis TaxID=2502781 RepID=A0A5B7ZXF4_9BACT|nr:porin family protein [Hymenobacter jejuensis]QDA59660.1 PorT family protein [Hymenobacter jejuensis]